MDWKVGTGKHGRCREVAVVGRFSTRGMERMDQQSGQENMAVVERWLLWGGFQQEEWSEWISSRDRKTWPL